MIGTFLRMTVREDLNSNLLGGGWVAINPAGLSNACFKIRIVNNSNIDIDISLDGINEHGIALKDGGEFVVDLQTNAPLPDRMALAQQGQIFYADATGAGAGLIHLEGYFV